jgi:hypothetical protein
VPDRQRDIAKLMVAIRNFANASRNDVKYPLRNTKVSKHEIRIFCKQKLSYLQQHCKEN